MSTPNLDVENRPLAVAMGEVARAHRLRGFGRGVGLGATTYGAYQGQSVAGFYPWPDNPAVIDPAGAELLDIVSDNAADDVGSTGAEKVYVAGLNELGLRVSETVDLDGVTPVPTANQYRSVDKLTVVQAGSGEENAGTITATQDTSAKVLGRIQPEQNYGHTLAIQIPSDSIGVIRDAQFSTSAPATWRLRIREAGGVFQVRDIYDTFATPQPPVIYPMVVGPMAQIEPQHGAGVAAVTECRMDVLLMEGVLGKVTT